MRSLAKRQLGLPALLLLVLLSLPAIALGLEAPSVGSRIAYLGPEGEELGVITVEDVTDPFTLHDPATPPQPGTRFALVTVAVENPSTEPLAIDPSTLLLQDSDGFLSSAAFVTPSPEATVPGPLSFGVLEPGDRVVGVIVIPVAEGRQIARVVFRPASDRLIVLADLTRAGPAPEPGAPATQAPAASPDLAASPPPFPNPAEEELLRHLLPGVRETCATTESDPRPASAAVICTVPLGDQAVTAVYQRFDDREDMARAYQADISIMDVEPDTGPCSGEWPAEHAYTIDGEEAGRVGCADVGGVKAMSWTDERLLVHANAVFTGAEQDLYEWWQNEAGPVLDPEELPVQ
jgi:hypothetical protein